MQAISSRYATERVRGYMVCRAGPVGRACQDKVKRFSEVKSVLNYIYYENGLRSGNVRRGILASFSLNYLYIKLERSLENRASPDCPMLDAAQQSTASSSSFTLLTSATLLLHQPYLKRLHYILPLYLNNNKFTRLVPFPCPKQTGNLVKFT